jgi:hypothetical protein
MKVVLNTFACSGIEAFLGRDIAAGVQTALRHYTRRGGSSERRTRELPRFISSPSLGSCGADLELAVDPEIQAVLEREARESGGVPVEQVAAHAVLVYLADRDRASKRGKRPLTVV